MNMITRRCRCGHVFLIHAKDPYPFCSDDCARDSSQPFGGWLAQVLSTPGMGVNELARRLGVAPGLVSMWANGQRSIRREQLLAIGIVLRLKVPEVNDGLEAADYQPLPEMTVHKL